MTSHDNLDSIRIAALMKIRSDSFCLGLQMGGETRDFFEDNHLIDLSDEKMDQLRRIVDEKMMKEWGSLRRP
jgi:hypothetical protein